MKLLERLSLLLVLLGLPAGLALASLAGREGTALPVPTYAEERIAYADVDGRVVTVRPDGSDPRTISPPGDGFFTWPTWSPDGRRLAFSGVTEDAEGRPKLSLYVADSLGQRVETVYEGEPGALGLLAEGVLHYPLWSPDGSWLAFIVATGTGPTLFLDRLDDGRPPAMVLDQGPLWMSWSSDGRYLLVHRGLEQFLVDVEADGQIKRFEGLRAVSYRAPAWRPGSLQFAYVSGRAFGEYRLLVGDLTTLKETALAKVPRQAAFLWSPDGGKLAVARSVLPGGAVYQDLAIYRADGSVRAVATRGNVVAFFWSPDGAKLAYVTAAEDGSVLRWNVLEPDTGEHRLLAEFLPSQDQLVLLQFFDQYAYSHSPWSPDSRYLVFAGKLKGQAVTAGMGAQTAVPQVVVLDVSTPELAQVIAQGRLAFWSPR